MKYLSRVSKPFLVLLAGAALAVSSPKAHAQSSNQADREFLAQWIVNLQYNNRALDTTSFGGIKIHTDPAIYGRDGYAYYRVVPYFSNLGVLGLLTTNDPNKLTVSQRWIDWYFSHLNKNHAPAGVPYEHLYRQDGSGETTTVIGQYNPETGQTPKISNRNDATDSAAATFFSVLWAAYKAGTPKSFFNTTARKNQIKNLAAVLMQLRDKESGDGLFYAKTDYKIKFLQDNCEVALGLRDLADLEQEVLGDQTNATAHKAVADALQQSIVSVFYNPSTKLYYTSKDAAGARVAPDLTQWYPSMQAQLWPQLQGVVPPKDAKSRFVVGSLNTIWDGSPKPSWYRTPDKIDQGFINSSVAYAVYLTGDTTRISLYLQAVKKLKYPTTSPSTIIPYPFVVSDAGWLVRILGQIQPQNETNPSFGNS